MLLRPALAVHAYVAEHAALHAEKERIGDRTFIGDLFGNLLRALTELSGFLALVFHKSSYMQTTVPEGTVVYA